MQPRRAAAAVLQQRQRQAAAGSVGFSGFLSGGAKGAKGEVSREHPRGLPPGTAPGDPPGDPRGTARGTPRGTPQGTPWGTPRGSPGSSGGPSGVYLGTILFIVLFYFGCFSFILTGRLDEWSAPIVMCRPAVMCPGTPVSEPALSARLEKDSWGRPRAPMGVLQVTSRTSVCGATNKRDTAIYTPGREGFGTRKLP